MQIDRITIALRPRSTWEAVDLGFGLTRLWWTRLLFCWLMTALPVFVIAAMVFRDNMFAVVAVFWWGKPLYEQLPLYFISRALFNEVPDNQQLLKALPRRMVRQLVANLTWRRFTMNRSYSAPIAQLEGLKGKPRRQRLQALSEKRNAGSWLTIVCLHFEAILYVSLIFLVWILVPFDVDFIQWISNHEDAASWGINTAYFVGAAVIAPFYVVSGFSLYLNRRTHLEGWDIELTFKRIRQRLGSSKSQTIAASIILTVIITATNPDVINGAMAADASDTGEVLSDNLVTPERAGEVIDRVLANKDFGEKKQVTTWKLKDSFDFDAEPSVDTQISALAQLFNAIANVSYYLVWILIALVAVWVIYQFPRWKNALGFSGAGSSKQRNPAQHKVFGLDVGEETLPDNVTEEAWRLFDAGRHRPALSLLYRASLSRLINHYGIVVKDSDTEGECARHVQRHQAQLAEFFSALTHAWIYTAYGYQPPSSDNMKQLCEHWNRHFGESGA
ncbi:MAG: DUF4129 domain-containing protein [Gammaproteobacteria bacterium]|jgi:hypothetical protein